MPTYQYVAINDKGQTMRGKVTAANELDLEDRLHELKLDLIKFRVIKPSRFGFGNKVKMKDLIILCVHLEQLDRAGVPLLDSLADLRDTADTPALRDLMADIFEDVKGGLMLSEALAKHPRIFSEVFVGLIRVGEETGNLSESFKHLGEHLKWNDALHAKVKKAIRYPIFLLFLLMGVVALMMMFVVPQLSEFLTSQGFDLPLHTRALIATSEAFVDYWYVIFGLPILTTVAIIILYRNNYKFAYNMDKFLMVVPFIGPVILKSNLSRFCHFFSVTFVSGIDILEALDTAQNVVNNRVIKETIKNVRQSVSQGTSITLALTMTERFPNLVLRMFKVGEESGNMEQALHNINFFYDREVNDAVDNIVGVIQPALTIIMGAILFWITAAVFGPLYDSFSKMEI